MTDYVLPDDDVPRITRAVQWLIAINVAIYFVQLTVVGTDNMELALGFQVRDLGHAWWTVVTYMFVHGDFWHIAANMYMLYVFGPRVEQRWSAGEFARYFILCGLGGWFAHLLFARGSLLIGASAAVYGVVLAYARQWPDEDVALFGVFPMQVKWLVAMYIAWDVAGGLSDRGLSGGTAHLATWGDSPPGGCTCGRRR